ncbi:hypothetical protein [Elizabethkingia anophelis]|nr:hypothetical protein [Elizabethkingia anophelis]MCT3960919.1 hypothetical protein [Elizabethkingia anophelis]MYY49765.1 hypothetical protein [Elizabethkingia anophelis]
MKKTILLYLLVYFYGVVSAQKNKNSFEKIDYYFTYKNYVENKPNIPEEAKIDIVENNSQYINYKSIISISTGEKIKKYFLIWGIKYNNELYFNMLNAPIEVNARKIFAKFDIVGKRYYVILLDTNKEKKAIGFNSNPYGGGIVGGVLNMKSKSTWKDKGGNSYKILFLDIQNPTISPSNPDNSLPLVLNTEKVLELYNNDPLIIDKLKKNEYMVEDFINFINNENTK